MKPCAAKSHVMLLSASSSTSLAFPPLFRCRRSIQRAAIRKSERACAFLSLVEAEPAVNRTFSCFVFFNRRDRASRR